MEGEKTNIVDNPAATTTTENLLSGSILDESKSTDSDLSLEASKEPALSSEAAKEFIKDIKAGVENGENPDIPKKTLMDIIKEDQAVANAKVSNVSLEKK